MSQVGGTKKTKLNNFSRFMFAYKAKEQAKGRNIDMNTATIEAGMIWAVSSDFLKISNLNILYNLIKLFRTFRKLKKQNIQTAEVKWCKRSCQRKRTRLIRESRHCQRI